MIAMAIALVGLGGFALHALRQPDPPCTLCVAEALGEWTGVRSHTHR